MLIIQKDGWKERQLKSERKKVTKTCNQNDVLDDMPAFNSGSSSVIPATINIANPGLRSRNNPIHHPHHQFVSLDTSRRTFSALSLPLPFQYLSLSLFPPSSLPSTNNLPSFLSHSSHPVNITSILMMEVH